jgi:glycosyltransferase involved in cell wall biosynthesis
MYLSLSEEHGPLLPDFAREVKILKLSLSSNISKVFEIGRNLKRICEDHDINAIICHTSPVSKAILRTAYFFRLPPIFPIEHTEINRQIKYTSSKWKNLTRLISTRFYYIMATAVFADSSVIRQELIDLKITAPDRAIVVHCPVDTRRMSGIEKKSSKKIFKIILVGRLEEVKNFKLIIDAMHIIQTREFSKIKDVKISVDIYGDGPKKKSLNKRATDKGLEEIINIYPFTNDIMDKIGQSNLLVSTSKFEGLGNAMLEAIACGVPVIATKTGGSTEISKHVDAITLVANDDAASLAERIIGQITQKELKVSKNDKQFIKSLSPSSTLEKYLRHIQGLVN